MNDTLNDERKRKMLRMKELDAKRVLDIQMRERQEKQGLKRYEDSADANVMIRDIKDFTEQEQKKGQEIHVKNLMQQTGLQHQIADRKKPK